MQHERLAAVDAPADVEVRVHFTCVPISQDRLGLREHMRLNMEVAATSRVIVVGSPGAHLVPLVAFWLASLSWWWSGRNVDAAQKLIEFGVSSGLAAGAYKVLKTWVEAKNGRKLKIKVGDIEVEATQMKEEDVLRIFELLEEKADRKKIRELLLKSSNNGAGRPEEH